VSRAQVLVCEWLRSVVLTGRAFEQVDVDQLGGHGDWSRPDVFAWSVELLDALGAEIRGAGRNESALLVVPLAYSDKLEPFEPSLAGMLSATWTELEMPGLYVLNDLQILGWDCEEEYRCILASNPAAKVSVAYYRCWRTGPSEFARALYFLKHATPPISA